MKEQTIDYYDLLHDIEAAEAELDKLIAAGVSNTEQVLREYLFTADNELDYGPSGYNQIASATTITFSELPSNTVEIFVYSAVFANSRSSGLYWKRNSGDTQIIYAPYNNHDAAVTHTDIRDTYRLPTDGNTIYCVTENGTCTEFKVIGYKVKE